MTVVSETDRLIIRHLELSDAGFVLELLNEPSFIRNIGDRGVRSIQDAESYVQEGPLRSYASLGYGLFLATLRSTLEPIGVCGLMRRGALEHADLAYAFLPSFHRRGFAVEAATAMLRMAREGLAMEHVLAITNPDNVASMRVLEKLGFRFVGMKRMPGDESDVRLFQIDIGDLDFRAAAS